MHYVLRTMYYVLCTMYMGLLRDAGRDGVHGGPQPRPRGLRVWGVHAYSEGWAEGGRLGEDSSRNGPTEDGGDVVGPTL